MTAGIETLTDKEKEALRLLLAGHEAKSIANTLGLSVYTINDRLRSARRKLGTSSSREAARILGEAEESAPESLAHKQIGMVPAEQLGAETGIATDAWRGLSRSAWLTGGMLIMSLIIAAAALGLALGGPQPAPEATPMTQTATDDAVSLDRAQRFLALVDADRWEDSWEAAGPYFQSQTTAEEWAAVIEPVRAPLGAVQSRELITVQRASTLPGAPEGEYEVLQFNTQFVGRSEEAVETIIALQGEGGWEVVGYFIR